MSEKVTFRSWIANLWQGVWQALCWIGRAFNPKYKTPFWRVIGAIMTVCVLLITGMLGYAFRDEFKRQKSSSQWEERYDPYISPDYKYRNNGKNKGMSYIYDAKKKNKVITDIDWIAVPIDGDSLIVVAKNGKRGFVNRYTAKTAIPFKYDAAWSFTDGVSGVCEGDSVYFIDHSGRPINHRKLLRAKDYNGYVYHGNYTAVPVNGKYGLLDRDGNWVLEPRYKDIQIGPRDMWYIVDNDKWGVVGNDGRVVIPIEFDYIWIHKENGITVSREDHTQSRYDYDGSLLDKFVFDEVCHLAYYINEFDMDGNQKQAVDDMLKYSSSSRYGLMTKAGVPVTKPLYSEIEVVSPGVYQCHIPETYECIMVNRNGEKINE